MHPDAQLAYGHRLRGIVLLAEQIIDVRFRDGGDEVID
jgi:hypothetical protein